MALLTEEQAGEAVNEFQGVDPAGGVGEEINLIDPKMLQDVERGQRTEVSYLLGHALPIAGRLRLPVPHLTELQQRLRARLAERGLPED